MHRTACVPVALHMRRAGAIVSGRAYKAGTQAGGYEGSATRASVNDLAGLAAVGDKVGVYGVVTARTDALYAPLTSEWNGTPLMDNVRTTGD